MMMMMDEDRLTGPSEVEGKLYSCFSLDGST